MSHNRSASAMGPVPTHLLLSVVVLDKVPLLLLVLPHRSVVGSNGVTVAPAMMHEANQKPCRHAIGTSFQ
jgi:hypothetical protein